MMRSMPPRAIGTDATIDSGGGDTVADSQADTRGRPPQVDLPEISRSVYIVRGELARGGMGKILVAEDTRLGRDVALKELIVVDPMLVARFAREVRMTARLQHPGIVAVYEAGRWPDGEPFYAMRLVKGRSLEKVVESRPELADRLRLVSNLVNLTEAMAYAHDRNIIHRDLKPANVLVGDYGETVVIDWGLAKDLEEDDVDAAAAPVANREGLTMHGSIVGTPAYMPPEQARGETVDKRADVYAIGALIWHVLAGRAPFTGTSVDEILESVKASTLAPLATLVPEVPQELVTIVERAMAHDPDLRYPSARELAEDLASFQAGKLVASHHYSTWQLARRWVRRHRALVLAIVALLVGGGIVAAVTVRQVLAERDRAEAATTAALAEQGRKELVASHPRRAAVYLAEAYRGGRTDEVTRTMLGEAMRAVDGNTITVDLATPIATALWVRGGRAIVALTDRGDVELIDAATGARTLVSRPKEMSAMHPTSWAVSADGTWIVANDDRRLRAIDVEHRRITEVADVWNLGELRDLSISAHGERVALVAGGALHLWSTADGKDHPSPFTAGVVAAGFTAGDELRVVFADHFATAAALGDGAAHDTQAQGPITNALVCGETSYGIADDGDAVLDSAHGPHLLVERRHLPGAIGLGCGGEAVLVGRDTDPSHGVPFTVVDGTRAIDLALAGERADVIGTQHEIGDVHYEQAAIDPTGRFVATGTSGGSLVVWDVTAALPLARIDAHVRSIRGLAFDATGTRLATASDDGTLRVWDLARWTEPTADAAPKLAGSRDGKTTAQAVLSEVELVSPAGRTRLGRGDDLLTWVDVSPNGRRVAAAGIDGGIVEWDTETHALVAAWDQATPITTGSIADDGTVATGANGVVNVWQPGSHDAIAQLVGHAATISRISWDPTGATLMTVDEVAVRLWDRKGALIRHLDPEDLVGDARWLDGGRLVAIVTRRTMQVWDAAHGTLVAQQPGALEAAGGLRVVHGLPVGESPRGVVRFGAQPREWILARADEDGDAVAARVAARVAWRLVDGALIPAAPPITGAEARSDAKGFRFEHVADPAETSPTRPRIALATPRANLDKDAAAIVEAAAALQLGHRQAAARARLAGLGTVDDPALIYALAWCRHWLGDDALAYDTLVRAVAHWPDPTQLDALHADVRRFAAWGGIAASRARAVLGDTMDDRAALATAYTEVGRDDLAETVLVMPATDPLRRDLDLSRLAYDRADPIAVATHLEAAAAVARDATVPPLISSCTHPGIEIPTGPPGASGVAIEIAVRAAAMLRIYEPTADFRYAIAARRLDAVLERIYGVDVTRCAAELDRYTNDATRTGTPDPAVVLATLARAAVATRACYARALDDDPALATDLAFRITLSIRGTVESVDAIAEPASPAASAVIECARAPLVRATFPRLASRKAFAIFEKVALRPAAVKP